MIRGDYQETHARERLAGKTAGWRKLGGIPVGEYRGEQLAKEQDE